MNVARIMLTVSLAATTCATSLSAPAEPVASAAQAHLDYFAGDHGWAVCRYAANVDMPGHEGGRYAVTIQVTADWLGPPEATRLSVQKISGPASRAADLHLGLGAAGSAPLFDQLLDNQDRFTRVLPPAVAIDLLRALGERDDLQIRIGDGADAASFSATPAKNYSSEAWRDCLAGVRT